jgi:hypothetical protein
MATTAPRQINKQTILNCTSFEIKWKKMPVQNIKHNWPSLVGE